jgi:xylono-1,5-lactonase
MQAELLWDARCRLGEGTVWNVADASVYFVDILGREVLALTPASGRQRRWALPQRIGWLLPRARGGWLAGLQQGVVALTLDGEPRIEWLHRLHGDDSPLRLNDAKADVQGRLWFGSMDGSDETRPVGRLYRLDNDGSLAVVDEGYCVTNGPSFSPDGRTLYHTDSALRTVYAFDLDDAGRLSRKRTWLEFASDEGFPDGMTTDAMGRVWIAHWGGARVTCRDPEDGRVLLTIALPVPQVTNVCFGGPDLRDLFVSSARRGLEGEALARAPLAGGLFRIADVGQGLPVNAAAC